jgi:hypothetical protein
MRYKEGMTIKNILFLRELEPALNIRRGYTHRTRKGVFICPFCNKEFEARLPNITSGHTTSCGCKKGLHRHGMNTTKRRHPIYNSWAKMKDRCTNKNHKNYHLYGGRNIEVCEKWLTFSGFLEDMGEAWAYGLTIDRINNHKGYYKENCRWATKEEQTLNKRKKHSSGIIGVTFNTATGKWIVTIKRKYLGIFNTIEEAIQAKEKYANRTA